MAELNEDENVEVTFALTPSAAMIDVINYETREGQKLCSLATRNFMGDNMFDVTPAELPTFLNNCHDHCLEMAFLSPNDTGIMHIPDDDANPTTYSNLVTHHGEVPLERITEYEATYIGNESRAAQDTHNLYKSLMNSLSQEGKSKVSIWKEQHIINGCQSGVALFKVIVRESHLDTNATVTTIRTQLSSLDVYVHTIGCDITKLNQYVKELVTGLTARGETTNDLLVNLFKGYLAVKDKEFVRYIDRKKDAYDEGKDMTPDDLMNTAANKCKLMKQAGKWEAPEENEEKIIALEAKVQDLKKLQRKIQDKSNKRKRGNSNGAGKTPKAKPEWLEKNQKPSDVNQTKTWNQNKYHWYCKETGGKCEGKWRVHKPKECKGYQKGTKPGNKTANDRNKNDGNNAKRSLKLFEALQAEAVSDDDDSVP